MTALSLREKFDLRMNTLPTNAIVVVKIVTDKNGTIISWSVKKEDELEGLYKSHEFVNVLEE